MTTYTYTHAGALASTTDATGHNTWTTTYDLLGRTASSADPDTGTTSYTYDNDGRVLTSTDASNRTLANVYDNLGRKTAEYQNATNGTLLASWTYDTLLKDKPTSSSRYANGKTYTNTIISYDTAGRVTSSRFTIPLTETGFGGTYSFSWRYDPASDVLRSFASPAKGGLPDESMLTFYDALDKPSTFEDVSANGTTLVSETDYNPYGQVLRNNYQDPTLPNQLSVTHTYADGTNRLATTLAERATSTNYMIGNRAYTYDPSGDITTIADTPQGAAADTQCFTYDYVQRLTQAWTPGSGNCATTPSVAGLGGAAPYWTSWTFDQAGNRLTQTQHGSGGDTTAVSSYPAAGQVQPHAIQALDTTSPGGATHAGYTYDPAGRTLTQGASGAGFTFTYDAEGRVATATDAAGKVSSYTYDADGKLFLTKDATGTTLTLNDLELFRAAGSSSTVGTRFYTFNGHPVAERSSTAGLSWMLTDNQDTTYATVNADNLAVAQRWQDPYGVARGPAPTGWPDKHGYVGGYQNTTGLTHLGARDYDPLTGRFTTVDPIMDTANPQQFNGYSYAGGNPVVFSDPSGLCHGPDGSCPLPGGGYGGGDACRIGGWSCGDFNPDVCGCTGSPGGGGGSSDSDFGSPGRGRAPDFDLLGLIGAPERPMKVLTPLSLLSLMPGYLTQRETSRKSLWREAGSFLYEASGIADLQSCIDSPSVVGCIKGVVNVGIWFVPGGGLVKGAEGLYAGGRAVEGALAESRAESAAAEDAARSCLNSFAGETPVTMADGSAKPIKDVKVGDKVLNAEPDSSNTEIHAVTAVHVTDTDHDFVDVTVATPDGPKKITTTAHHRFWDATTHTWTDATNLTPGDQLDTPGNGHATIESLTRYTTTTRTYNLTIDQLHTYYVDAGPTSVLVHNCGGYFPGHADSCTCEGIGDITHSQVDKAGDLTSHAVQ